MAGSHDAVTSVFVVGLESSVRTPQAVLWGNYCTCSRRMSRGPLLQMTRGAHTHAGLKSNSSSTLRIPDADKGEREESQEVIAVIWAQSGNNRITGLIVRLLPMEETTVSSYSLYFNPIYQHEATGHQQTRVG